MHANAEFHLIAVNLKIEFLLQVNYITAHEIGNRQFLLIEYAKLFIFNHEKCKSLYRQKKNNHEKILTGDQS